jgi:hypothetical protein
MDVEEYKRTRYKGIDQKVVNKRERKILEKIFESIEEKSISILDVPCGYGRFSLFSHGSNCQEIFSSP